MEHRRIEDDVLEFVSRRKSLLGLSFLSVLMLIGVPVLVLTNQPKQFYAKAQTAGAGSALRFTGSGNANVNRVNIPLDNPERPVDIGAEDFTIEWWMQVNPGEVVNSGACQTNGVNWINGDIIIDRDVDGPGDYGDYGISLFGGGLAFGAGVGSNANTICGSRNLADGQWHHLAVTRNSTTGSLSIYVDGSLDAQGTGPTGNSSYRNNRSGNTWDPYLVLGAEKHNYVPPIFRGTMDELRISNTIRYAGNFARPSTAFTTDPNTVLLYHFDEGAGTTVNDTSGAVGGPSTGTIAVGGSNSGPVWVTSTAPFAIDPNVTPIPTATPPPPTPTQQPGAQISAAIAYGFDQGSGTVALNSADSGNNGTITSGTWSSSGRYGSALSFNGTATRVTAPSISLPGSFTLMAWVNNPGNSSYETLLTVGSNRDLYLQNGVPSFYDGLTERQFGSALSTGVWHHVALVSQGTLMQLYVDGVPQGATQSVSLGSITGVLQIGAWISGSSNVDFYSGLLDEARVYNQALTQAEIQTAMNAPYGGGSAITPTPTIFQIPTATPALPTPTPTVTIATPTPVATQTITFTPVADAYIDNTSSTTRRANYGQATVLNVDSSPQNIGYLRFDLSSLAGRNVVSARLRVRTATDTSVNQQRVKPVSNITWNENTITYATRPSVTNTVLGTINSQNQANVWQEVPLTATVVANRGQSFSLAIDSGGGDNVWFWSRESTSSPELVVEVQ